MGKHASTSDSNGKGNFDLSKTKDVRESDSGKHSDQDQGDQGQQDDQQ